VRWPTDLCCHPVYWVFTWFSSVSMLQKYYGDPSHVLNFSSVQLVKDLTYVEEPVAIFDKQVRKLRLKNIASVKVR